MFSLLFCWGYSDIFVLVVVLSKLTILIFGENTNLVMSVTEYLILILQTIFNKLNLPENALRYKNKL